MRPLYDVTTYSFPMFMLLSVAVNVELTLLCMMLVICLPFIVCMVCPEKRGCGFQYTLATVKIYLQHLASKFHILCRKWAYTLPFEIYRYFLRQKTARRIATICKLALSSHRRNSVRNNVQNVCHLAECIS